MKITVFVQQDLPLDIPVEIESQLAEFKSKMETSSLECRVIYTNLEDVKEETLKKVK